MTTRQLIEVQHTPRGPVPQTCRSCNAPVFWVRTRNDKKMLLDMRPSEGGNIVIAPLDREGWDPATDFHYTSHFVTCPHAEAWRRKAEPVRRRA